MLSALCFSGEPRSLQFTHRNLRQTFDYALGAYDIFGYLPKCDTSHQLVKYFPEANVRIVEDSPIDDSFIHERTKFKTGPQRFLQQLHGWKQVNQMRKEKERVNNFNYDFIVRCRMDLVFVTLPTTLQTLERNTLYIPNFQHWGGLNDRFCVGSPQVIDDYMNIIDLVKLHSYKFTGAESFLKFCLNIQNTNFRLLDDVKFCRVRENGEHLLDHFR